MGGLDLSASVTGFREAKKFLDDYTPQKIEGVKRILLTKAMDIQRQAKDNAQALGVYDTGRLIASISTCWSWSSKSRGEVEKDAKPNDGVIRPDEHGGPAVNVGSGVDYALYNELGTIKMEARPYLYPAYLSKEGEIIRDVGAEMAKTKT